MIKQRIPINHTNTQKHISMKDIVDYEEFLYNIQTGKENELDIFYLFFGITRQIIWEISPFLKVYMIDE